jgi:hypothetical protein
MPTFRAFHTTSSQPGYIPTWGGLHSRPGLKFDFSTLHSTQPRFTRVFREPTFISTRGEFNPELSTSDSHCTRCNPGRIFCNPCAHAHTQITKPACAMHRKRDHCGARACARTLRCTKLGRLRYVARQHGSFKFFSVRITLPSVVLHAFAKTQKS